MTKLRRSLATAVTAAMIALTSLVAPLGASAGAQDDPAPSTTLPPIAVQAEAQHSIIPIPQASGSFEVQPGQPGSNQQYLVFVLIIGGLAAICVLVGLESRRKRSALGIAAVDPTTLYEEDLAQPQSERSS